jgi:alpha-tubulin suppressor-like RCC1 family protein
MQAVSSFAGYARGLAWFLILAHVLSEASTARSAPVPGMVVNLGAAPTPPADLTNAVAIAVGDSHYLALRSDGTVTGWGTSQHHAELPPAGLSNVIAIAAGSDSSTALKSDSTIVGWALKGIPTGGLSNVVSIASGHDHRLAVKSDGTIVSWGVISEPPPSGYSSNYQSVAAGWDVSIGRRGDGTAVSWGTFVLPSPILLSNVIAIGSGCCGHVLVAVQNDGTVQGINTTVPVGLSNVVAVSGNESGGLALKNDSTVVGWTSAAPAGQAAGW